MRESGSFLPLAFSYVDRDVKTGPTDVVRRGLNGRFSTTKSIVDTINGSHRNEVNKSIRLSSDCVRGLTLFFAIVTAVSLSFMT